jgi:hypothetical protein
MTGDSGQSETSSISSDSTNATGANRGLDIGAATSSLKNLTVEAAKGHRRNASGASLGVATPSPRSSVELRSGVATPRSTAGSGDDPVVLFRETQRISLRAFLRTLLGNSDIAKTKAVEEFLTFQRITLSDEDIADIEQRRAQDDKRLEEQKQFYEVARKRAAELDVYMEQFRKNSISEMSLQYQKFCEWLRIEVAATIYHLFLAEDNSPEVFAQAKKAHSMIPYTIIKNAIRIANPAAVMSSILDIFLAQPFGTRSLMQRIFGLMLNDGIKAFQKSIDGLVAKIDDRVFCEKLHGFAYADETIKDAVRADAEADQVDLIVAILRSEAIEPPLQSSQIGRIFNAYVAWNNVVDNVDSEMVQGAELFSHLKQLLKLYTRQRDKAMLLSLIEEPVTLQLLRDLFTIFYEPLVRVYKSANVYNSVTDFSVFVDDMIQVCRRCTSSFDQS